MAAGVAARAASIIDASTAPTAKAVARDEAAGPSLPNPTILFDSIDSPLLRSVGGFGVLIGEGRLQDSSSRRLVEPYYRLTFVDVAEPAARDRLVDDPASDRDLKPMNFPGARLHAQV